MQTQAQAESPLTLGEMGIEGRTGKEQYLSMFLFLYGGLYNVIASPDLAKESMKVYYVIKEMINFIPIKSERDEIIAKLKENINKTGLENMKEDVNMTPIELAALRDKKKHLLIDASLDTLGDITDFVNQHFDLTLENTIGVS